MKTRFLNPITNQRGILTVDFIFAFLLVWGLTMMVVFRLTLTLSVVEVVQYMSFATARSFFAGHHTLADQIARGENKFASLKEHPVLNPLFSNGWFEIKEVKVEDFTSEYAGTSQTDPLNSMFAGVRVLFLPIVLDFEIPGIGATVEEHNDPFNTKIASYLGREPTDEECTQFNSQRFRGILKLGYQDALVQSQEVRNMEDNGC